jgi:hypothetical protein
MVPMERSAIAHHPTLLVVGRSAVDGSLDAPPSSEMAQFEVKALIRGINLGAFVGLQGLRQRVFGRIA